MKVLGLIPARGDSTGCPGKNLRVLGSKPLIQWTVDAWIAAGQSIKDLVLSTESHDLMRQFHGSGMRLVDQGARTDDPTKVIDQVLAFWPETEILLYLQPTTPFKRPGDIVKSIEMIDNGDAKSVVTMMEIPKRFHPFNAFEDLFKGDMYPDDAKFTPTRQRLEPRYSRDGCVYAFHAHSYSLLKSIYPHPCRVIETDPIDYCNIDSEEDWKEAQWRAAEIESPRYNLDELYGLAT